MSAGRLDLIILAQKQSANPCPTTVFARQRIEHDGRDYGSIFCHRNVRFHGLPDRGISPLCYFSTDARMLGKLVRALALHALIQVKASSLIVP